jgi:hypothetical protein
MSTGFTYHSHFLDAADAERLLATIRELPFRTDTVRGKTMRRTIVCYGNDYKRRAPLSAESRTPDATVPRSPSAIVPLFWRT